jgi:hypothetical protein
MTRISFLISSFKRPWRMRNATPLALWKPIFVDITLSSGFADQGWWVASGRLVASSLDDGNDQCAEEGE